MSAVCDICSETTSLPCLHPSPSTGRGDEEEVRNDRKIKTVTKMKRWKRLREREGKHGERKMADGGKGES